MPLALEKEIGPVNSDFRWYISFDSSIPHRLGELGVLLWNGVDHLRTACVDWKRRTHPAEKSWFDVCAGHAGFSAKSVFLRSGAGR